MYLQKEAWAEQINKAIEWACKPIIDLLIHWLNPLLHKCFRQLYPDKLI